MASVSFLWATGPFARRTARLGVFILFENGSTVFASRGLFGQQPHLPPPPPQKKKKNQKNETFYIMLRRSLDGWLMRYGCAESKGFRLSVRLVRA